tara:strand:- start:431 stop:658 length:228 start_codon:yes stop_codon:yes gene_type:complete
MNSKERMKSWEDLFGGKKPSEWSDEPKPSWETWKRILRMPHVNHDPKLASQQWDKIVENHKRKKKKMLDSIIFKV